MRYDEYRSLGLPIGSGLWVRCARLSGWFDDYCGIWYWTETGAQMVLARYNGPSHRHGSIRFKPHIHKVTEEVLAAGKRPDSEATETDRYTTLQGATDCLIEDFNVTGFSHRVQQAELQ